MNTQTHVLMGAVLFGKPVPRLAWVAAAGGFIPDLPMYAIIGALRMQGYSLDVIFGQLYWQDWWQIANAIGHNFLLWGSLSVISALTMLRGAEAGQTSIFEQFRIRFAKARTAAMVFAFSAAALISSLTDFLLHHNDGHMHFWPLSEWRFQSPVSYWDPNHHGATFGFVEAALGVLLAIVLFRRYANIGIRIVLFLVLLAYIAVPLFYFWTLSGHDHKPGQTGINLNLGSARNA